MQPITHVTIKIQFLSAKTSIPMILSGDTFEHLEIM